MTNKNLRRRAAGFKTKLRHECANETLGNDARFSVPTRGEHCRRVATVPRPVRDVFTQLIDHLFPCVVSTLNFLLVLTVISSGKKSKY